jgi:hypothetical protein
MQILIGTHKWGIEEVEYLKIYESSFGYVNWATRRIFVLKNIAFQNKVHTYIHELIHAVAVELDIRHLYGEQCEEEQQDIWVDVLAYHITVYILLSTFLYSLGIKNLENYIYALIKNDDSIKDKESFSYELSKAITTLVLYGGFDND